MTTTEDFERRAKSDAARERFRSAAAKTRSPNEEWWTPERVRNQAQASFIKLQADHFGEMSPAGRFFSLCVDRGAVDRSGTFIGRAQAVREPGEDEDFMGAAA